MLISGAPVTTVRDRHRESRRVAARGAERAARILGHVADLTVTSRNGVAVPLTQIAKIEYAHEEPILWRRNRDMAITVRATWSTACSARCHQPICETAGNPRQLQPAYRSRPVARSRIRQEACLDLRAVSADGHRHADLADDAVAELLAAAAGIPHSPPRHHRGVTGLNVANQPFGFVALLGLIALAGMIMAQRGILVDQIETMWPQADPQGGNRGSTGPSRPPGRC